MQHRAAVFESRDKVLNLRNESKRREAVTNRRVAQNKFTIHLRLSAAQKRFRCGAPRYADK
jgi:hypothetical protein